jgi:hypothetical protein
VSACRLESRGPNWQNPAVMDVLRRLPFLASAPDSLLLWLRAYGELKVYEPGQCIIPRRVRRSVKIDLLLRWNPTAADLGRQQVAAAGSASHMDFALLTAVFMR